MKKIPYRTIALLIFVTLLIIVPFCIWGDSIDAWTGKLIKEGKNHPFYTGSILGGLLASDIVLPVPSCIVSTACGLTLGFVKGSLVSFGGMTVSCLGGYALGRLFTPAAEKMLGKSESERMRLFHKKYGIWLVLAMRPVPVLAEASMLFAGIARQHFGRTMIIATIGNLVVSGIYAAVGAYGEAKESTVTAFTVSVLLSGIMMLVSRKRVSKGSTKVREF
ncbi:MAG: VTT domain-containing protein [Kiritimatiellae bacterium]|jgi:uncharacterized membrane protein YdjX (TVP38/TMEM64 family)|nr:VTT domain-containing protein [Kiritimatiellia bacterium]